MLVSRDTEQLSQTGEEFREINSRVEALAVPTDIGDETSVNTLFEKAKAKFGTADVLALFASACSSVSKGDMAAEPVK